MFTGIVQAVGKVESLESRPGGARLVLEVPEGFTARLESGDSIAVDGACLTVVNTNLTTVTFDLLLSTLGRTIASGYREGSQVNLETGVRAGDKMDGHIVQGHVDGIGHLISPRDEGGSLFLTFQIPPEVQAATILYGSIALNGVSLTVNELEDPDGVGVAIIPHTRDHTNLGSLIPGDRVNVEGDLIGKYVGRFLEQARPFSR